MSATLFIGIFMSLFLFGESSAEQLEDIQALKTIDDTWRKDLEKNLFKTAISSNKLESGKITAVYFSASWCGPCKQFTPKLIEFSEKNKKYFQVVFASLDKSEQFQLEYMKSTRMFFPTISCESTFIKKIAEQSEFSGGIPTLAVFDPNGGLITSEGRELIQFYDKTPNFGKEVNKESFKVWKFMVEQKRVEHQRALDAFFKGFERGGPVEQSFKYWMSEYMYENHPYKVFSDEVLIKKHTKWTLDDYLKLIDIYNSTMSHKEDLVHEYIGLKLTYKIIPAISKIVSSNVDDKVLLSLLTKYKVSEDYTTYEADSLLWLLSNRMAITKNKQIVDYFWKLYKGPFGNDHSSIKYLTNLAQQGDNQAFSILEKFAQNQTYGALVGDVLDQIVGHHQKVAKVRKIISQLNTK